MILGRPTNLWLGLTTALLGLIQVTVIAVRPDVDPAQLATVLGATGLFLGAAISVIANQAPVVNSGDTVKVVTPEGQPNYEISA